MADIQNIPLNEKLRDSNLKINNNFKNLNADIAANSSSLQAHKESTNAHASENITYAGQATGPNVKQAIDGLSERITNLIVESGDSSPEVVDARGGFPVLSERLNASDARINEVEQQADEKSIGRSKTAAMYAHAVDEMSVIPNSALSVALKSIELGTLRVAVMGDSISAGGDLVLSSEGYVERLERKLKQQLPKTTIALQNFSLGGRRISEALNPNFVGGTVNEGLTFYTSWSVIGKSWLDHVKDFAPDLFIIAFGMNEAWVSTSDFDFYTRLKTLVDTSQTWTSKPSPVYVSTILPTTNPEYYDQSQEITKAVNRAGRVLAKEYGLPIVDAGRLWEIVRDGIDEQYSSAVKVSNFEDYSSWTGAKDSFTLSNGSLAPNEGVTNKYVLSPRSFYNGDISVNINPSIADVNGTTWIMYRYSDLGHMLVQAGAGDGTGFLRLYTNDDGAYTPLVDLANLNIPINANTRLVIRVLNERHQVFIDGVLLIDHVSRTNFHEGGIRFGSQFTPPTFSSLDINYADPIKGDPLYTELELLGEFNSSQSGNGINHPTGLGTAVTYCAALTGLIRELATRRLAKGNFLPHRIPNTQNGWFATPEGWTQTNTNGQRLYTIAVPLAQKYLGVALRRVDNGSYYTLINTSSTANLAGVVANTFAYLENVNGNDFIVVSSSSGSIPTEVFDLYQYR